MNGLAKSPLLITRPPTRLATPVRSWPVADSRPTTVARSPGRSSSILKASAIGPDMFMKVVLAMKAKDATRTIPEREVLSAV